MARPLKAVNYARLWIIQFKSVTNIRPSKINLRAKELNLCTKCLGGHLDSHCKGIKGFPYPCIFCGLKNHYSIMCPKSPKSCVGRTTLTGQGNCIFPVLKISMRINKHPVYFYCLLDTGSQRSFFSQAILTQLNSGVKYKPRSVDMSVNTMIGSSSLNLQELHVSLKLGFQKPFSFPTLFAGDLNLRFNVDGFDEITSNLIKEGFRLCPGYRDLNGSTINGIIRLFINF